MRRKLSAEALQNTEKVYHLPWDGNNIITLRKQPGKGNLTGCYPLAVLVRNSLKQFSEIHNVVEIGFRVFWNCSEEISLRNVRI
jgi:hypothetical protein